MLNIGHSTLTKMLNEGFDGKVKFIGGIILRDKKFHYSTHGEFIITNTRGPEEVYVLSGEHTNINFHIREGKTAIYNRGPDRSSGSISIPLESPQDMTLQLSASEIIY